MAKTFVFFIGGTGARVLRSLTMLLATGVEVADTIVPIIIDYDADNADLTRAKEIISRYQKIHHAVYSKIGSSHNEKNTFFSTKIQTIDDASKKKNGESDGNRSNNFCITLSNEQTTFGQKIGFDDLPPKTKDFLSLLYDNSPSNRISTELNLNIKVGFKGNPNVGSAIFNEIMEDPAIKDKFIGSFNEGDKVYIVGSIFGGTGSTGIPQIIMKCRDKNNKNKQLQEARIGGCIVLPYFKLENGGDKSAIDSSVFISKTKAALQYYNKEINSKVDRLYYVGTTRFGNAINNNDGGKEQSNDAHLIDMISAMSVIDFISAGETDGKYFEYSVPDCRGDIFDLSLFGGVNNDFLYRLNSFTYFWKYYKTFIKTNGFKGSNLDKDLFKGANVEFNEFIKTLDEFLLYNSNSSKQYSYESWLNEMANNKSMIFKPYQLENSINDLLVESELIKNQKIYNNSLLFGKNQIGGSMDTYTSKTKNKAWDSQTKFILASSIACNEVAENNRK